MHSAKSLLAILVVSMILSVVLSAAPTRAAADTGDAVASAVSLTSTEAIIHGQIDQLSGRAREVRRSASLRRRLLRTARDVTHLSRRVSGLDRYTLSLGTLDDATYRALLSLTVKTYSLDVDALRLTRRALPRNGGATSGRIRAAARQLLSLEGEIGVRWQDVPTPTPYPTPTPSPSPTSVPADAFNVMAYGAVHDGVTDDVAAVQKAINACSAAGGGYVYMPAGTYSLYAGHNANFDLGCALELRDGVHLIGDGPSLTILTSSREGLNTIGASQVADIGVSEMTVVNGWPIRADAVKLVACSRVDIFNVVTFGRYSGIALLSCSSSTIVGCVAYGSTNIGICFGVGPPGFSNPEGNRGYNNVAIDCEAYDCGTRGFAAYGQGPLDADLTSFVRCNAHDNGNGFLHSFASNVTMTDCVAEDNSFHNVLISGVHGARLHNTAYSGAGGTAAYVVDATHWPAGYAVYGDSSGIVED